jgi:DNA-directed RNA polymerase specialized sigma subunit
MTEHLKNKHLLNTIADEDIRRELIARCALDDTDKKILTMRYVKHQDFGYIADTLGLSYSAVGKRHKKALILIQSLARARVNSV